VDVHLAAVQVEWSPALYASEGAFRERMVALARAAVAEAGEGPRLVAFPELIGLPLLLTAAGDQDAVRAPDVVTALGRLARRDAGRWLRTAWRTRRLGASAFYGTYAVEAYRMWHDTFAAAARASGAVVVAGSAFLPDVDEEPSLGWFVRDPAVHNAALTFAPGGRLVARTAKVHLTPGAERRAGLRRGRIDDLHPITTGVGRVGVAVCLDGFHERVLATLDGRGAQVVVQPSANDADWERAWPRDPGRSEGDAWIGEGLRARIQGRSSLRYGVNPMLVGDVLGLRPRGRSNIVVNLAGAGPLPPSVDDTRWPGMLAVAPDACHEAIVTARVPHPGP
jgi:predicted amidohydrolase